jgi:outer membrane protein OmpA-like peptidoglycan-associated protein
MEDDMSPSILSTMNSFLNDNLIDKASAAFGEPASGVGTALRLAGPALLAGIMKKGASPDRIYGLFAGVTGPRIDENFATKATKLLGDSTGLGQLLSMGDSLVSGIFDDKVDAVSSALSEVAGVKPESARKMLAFAAPMLGGVMKSFVAKQGLNAAGLASTLAQERDSIVSSSLDPRLISAMGIDDLGQTVDSFSDAGRQAEAALTEATKQASAHAQPIKHRSSWLSWSVGAAAAVLGVVLIAGLLNRDAGQPALQVNVYFDRDQATIDNDDRRAIAVAAASAQATGGALTLTPVAATRDATDQQIATQRAATIRDALIDEGVENERIVLRSAQLAQSEEPGTDAQRVEIALAPTSENRSRN